MGGYDSFVISGWDGGDRVRERLRAFEHQKNSVRIFLHLFGQNWNLPSVSAAGKRFDDNKTERPQFAGDSGHRSPRPTDHFSDLSIRKLDRALTKTKALLDEKIIKSLDGKDTTQRSLMDAIKEIVELYKTKI